jgi:tRNA 2-thiouridine synthesizing protein E
MKEIEVAGNRIELTDEGFLTKPEQWNEEVARILAAEEGIELSDKHFEVLNYLRMEHNAGSTLTIRKVGKSGIVDIKGLYELFPGGPLKKSSKIAGIPKPSSCV